DGKVTSSDPKIKVLAQEQQVVMVNTTDREATATVDGKQVTLGAYEIRWAGRGGA
ncbi:MAG: xylan 1,4-beta-xylosidase, partial [Nonomuraea sp.]|nr:xylan 1,4-beta-xylosidase [Nonomuraea sp.]